ncbi:MAG TPA: FecR domain-containing protein [Polyangiaceae bacterium]
MRTPVAWRWPLVASAAVVVAVVVAVVGRGRSRESFEGALVVEPGAFTLPDGSTVKLQEGARMRLDRVRADRVESTLERGAAAFAVRHEDARLFVVHAGGFDVVDRGTTFAVTVDEKGGVRVSVESGSVGVHRAGTSEEGRVLGAGESWSSAGADVPSRTSAAVPDLEGAPPPSASGEPVPSATSHADAPATIASSDRRAIGQAAPDARELLETANAARVAGKPREAAAAFDAIRRRHRDDPRAGLAAFELGRLRLDALGDPAGAVEAFDDAIALAPAAPFREDAEARRVEALDRMHDGRCPSARASYLGRFPHGLHAAAVGTRCP